MAGMELEFLADRVETCGDEACEALVPDMMELFDAVLADYTDDSEVTVYNVGRGTSYAFVGKEGIEEMFKGLFKDMPQSGNRRNQV